MANRVAERRGAIEGLDHVGTRGDAPNEQGLAEIAGLLRYPALAGNIEKSTDANGRIADEADRRLEGRIEAQLQDIIRKNARFLEVGVQVVQAVVDGPRRHRLDDI